VLGVAGVEGNGQRDLAETLVGLKRQTKGEVRVLGVDVSNLHPDEIAGLGVGFVPEDRHSALVLDLSIKENLVLRQLDRKRFAVHGLINQQGITRHAREVIAKFAVAGGRPNVPARNLSGGNQQKVILARELHRRPQVLVAAQPTRGLDIAATAYVRDLIREQRDRGAAVLFISSDLDELFELSDKIAVILQGQILGIVPVSDANREEIGLMMAGESPALPAPVCERTMA
jgi:simple sugar transport system ATP-binding protein